MNVIGFQQCIVCETNWHKSNFIMSHIISAHHIMAKPKLWMHRLWQLPKGFKDSAISQGNRSQKLLIEAIFTCYFRRSSRSFWKKMSPELRSTSRTSTLRPILQSPLKTVVWCNMSRNAVFLTTDFDLETYGRTCLDGYLTKLLGILPLLYVHIGDYSTTFEVI